MYRFKDLKFLDIYDCYGKKVGCVEDIAIDYYEKRLKGFIISSKFFSKKNYIPIENVLTISDSIIVNKISTYDGLVFGSIKGFDIINKGGEMIGVVEELIISRTDFSLKGLVTATGLFEKFIKGKTILLIGETILGENSILYFGNINITLKSIPHNFLRQVKKYDEDK